MNTLEEQYFKDWVNHLLAEVSKQAANIDHVIGQNAELKKRLLNPVKHQYWHAGDKDRPPELKTARGELHTLRCKVCGNEDARKICQPSLD